MGCSKILMQGQSGEAYNIGVGSGYWVQVAEQMVGLARDLFGYSGKALIGMSEDADSLVNPQRRCPVIARARLDLGFNPTISLDEGLNRLLTWYSDNRKGEDA